VIMIIIIAAPTAYAMFKLLASKWLETKFSERLEAFKAQQQRLLEEMRFENNKVFDRLLKLHQREFDVLSEARGLLLESYSTAHDLWYSLTLSSDLNAMVSPQLEAFINNCSFANWEKEELRKAIDKNAYYQERKTLHDLNNAMSSLAKSHNFLQKNSIFLKKDIKERFFKIDELIDLAIREDLTNRQCKNSANFTPRISAQESFYSQGRALMTELENLIQERIWTQDTQLGAAGFDTPVVTKGD